MKQKLSIIMILLLAISLVGCSKTETIKNSKNEQNVEESKETTEAVDEEIEDVTFSDITYNPENGAMQVTAKNNTKYFIDSIQLSGKIDFQDTNGYGEEEVKTYEFHSSGTNGILIENEGLPPIYHLTAGEEKTFVFSLRISTDTTAYNNPVINMDKTKIIYRDKENDDNIGDPIYVAMDDEYEIEPITSESGSIESITIKNTSEYQWERLYVISEFSEGNGIAISDPSEGTLATWQTEERQIDIGETITINFKTPHMAMSGSSQDELDYVTRILSVSFQPRQ